MNAKRWRALSCAAVVLATTILSVTRAAADDSQTCLNGTGDVAIATCSRVIASGDYKGHNLASVYNSRGNAYKAKADYDRAIADYTQAIQLDPTDAATFTGRGIAYA